MNMEKDFVPYGPEWEKEVMKMSKVHIINMLRKALTSNEESFEEGYRIAQKEACQEIRENYHPNSK